MIQAAVGYRFFIKYAFVFHNFVALAGPLHKNFLHNVFSILFASHKIVGNRDHNMGLIERYGLCLRHGAQR